jgi:serine/threonine protein phosphatase PrpC
MILQIPPSQVKLPSMTLWLEETLMAMPSQGRLGLKIATDLAFGFTDDRNTEKGNQDRLAVAYCLDPSQSGEKWFFAGVCDGVGGEANGDVAASIALAEIISELCVGEATDPEKRLARAILRAHTEVQKRLHKRSATTFAGVLISERGGLAIGTVGDSRIYSVSDDEVVQLSQDDTLAEMLRRQLPQSPDQKIQETIQALKLQWQESLGQAIGSDLPLQPRTERLHLSHGAGCLLCTDGVWKPVESVLVQVVRASAGREDLARRLLTLTDNLGGTDNATAIVLPEIGKVHQWLRARHRPTEEGLVHIVLPGETAVVPWSLFTCNDPLLFPQQHIPVSTVSSKKSDDPPSRKPKRKPKTAKFEKIEGVQLTILEGARDDEASATGSVPKEY